MGNERITLAVVVCVGLCTVCAVLGMVTCSLLNYPIPPGLSAVAGTGIGILASSLPHRPNGQGNAWHTPAYPPPGPLP